MSGDELNLSGLPYPFKWNFQNTSAFLDEYEKRIAEFRNPKVKKKNLWGEISQVMEKMGYIITADSLDKKMRNMRGTYVKILDSVTTNSTRRIQWEYFTRFEQIFADDKTIRRTNIIATIMPLMPEHKHYSTDPNGLMEGCSINIKEEHAHIYTSADIQEYNISIKDAEVVCSEPASPSGSQVQEDVECAETNLFRKRKLEIESEKVQELKKIREQFEEQNAIQKEQLKIFKKLCAILEKRQ